MLATELLVALRGRGVILRLDRPPGAAARLFVTPASRLTEEDRAALRTNKPALLTLLAAEAADPATPLRLWEPEVQLALEVFPGARVIAHNVPAVWPPAGGWCPAPARHVDPYTSEPPPVPCLSCAGTTWHRAGTGWTCGTCHPQPSHVREEG